MDTRETVELFTVIAALYPREQSFSKADSETVKVWQRMLSDIPANIAVGAVQSHAATSQWPPSIAEIRQHAVNITSPIMDADQAYTLVRIAMKKFGYYQSKDAMETLPEDVREAVRSFGGFVSMCMSEEPEIQRAQFMKLWDAMKKRWQERALMPPDVLQLVDGLKMQLPEGGRA